MDLLQFGALQRCPPPCLKHKPLDWVLLVQPSILHTLECFAQYPYPFAGALHNLRLHTRSFFEGVVLNQYRLKKLLLIGRENVV